MRIFVISLKESQDRRSMIQQKLANIDFSFFDAVNLNQNPDCFILKSYDQQKTKRLHGYNLSQTEIGCFASHATLWQKCVETNETFLILEDNIEVTEDFYSSLNLIESLANKYKVLKLFNIVERKYKTIEIIDSKFKVISYLKGGTGTQGYAITPEAAQKYLSAATAGFIEPVDDFMDNEWRSNQTLYSLYPYVISRAKIPSTIKNRKAKTKRNIIDKIVIEFYRNYRNARRLIYNLFMK